MKRSALLPASAALLATLLGSCAPRQAPPAKPVTAVTEASGVSFYPHEAGLVWTYLPEGEAQGSQPYVLQGLGPTLFKEQSVQAVQLTGRGAQQTWYRQYSAAGVRLLGFTKPGVTVSLDPAWQEAPAEGSWKVGLTWEGSSKATVLDDAGNVKAQGTLKYRYEVQDFRQVKVPTGTYNVWVVTRQMSDDLGGLFPATQQYWFAPYIGDVRTPESLLLTGKNFTVKGSK